MTAGEKLDELMFRYHLLLIAWVMSGPLAGTPRKTVEGALASRIEDGLAVGYPFDGRTKVYGPTPRAARLHGVSAKRYGKPGAQTIMQSLLISQSCFTAPVPRTLFTEGEFRERFPDLADCPGVCRTRYFMDCRHAQPQLAVMVPDFGADYFRIARKAVKAIEERKKHPPFRTFLYHGLFRAVVLTGFELKATRIRESLAKFDLPCPVEVEVVAGFADLVLRRHGDE